MDSAEPLLPTVAQLQDWMVRVEAVRADAERADVHVGGLLQVLVRLRREVQCGRTVEGGCAARLLQVAAWLRNAGHAYAHVCALAREIIQYECLPSPGWRELCAEHHFTLDPIDGPNA